MLRRVKIAFISDRLLFGKVGAARRPSGAWSHYNTHPAGKGSIFPHSRPGPPPPIHLPVWGRVQNHFRHGVVLSSPVPPGPAWGNGCSSPFSTAQNRSGRDSPALFGGRAIEDGRTENSRSLYGTGPQTATRCPGTPPGRADLHTSPPGLQKGDLCIRVQWKRLPQLLCINAADGLDIRAGGINSRLPVLL